VLGRIRRAVTAPLGGFDRQPRGLSVALVVLAAVPALWYGWAVYSDFLRGTRLLGSDPIKAAEHAYGIWTIRFVVATLAVTPLRAATGWNWVARHRRTLGLYAFAYGVLHFLVWALLDMQLVIDNLVGWDIVQADLLERPFITIGMVALLLMVPLAITSTRAMIARLGKRWRVLHRLVYVVAVLGVVHFWMSVKRDIREPLVYAVLVGSLLLWRWVRGRGNRRTARAAGTGA
jgi:sulfoxide reductase heme-binding subunit YedZ